MSGRSEETLIEGGYTRRQELHLCAADSPLRITGRQRWIDYVMYLECVHVLMLGQDVNAAAYFVGNKAESTDYVGDGLFALVEVRVGFGNRAARDHRHPGYVHLCRSWTIPRRLTVDRRGQRMHCDADAAAKTVNAHRSDDYPERFDVVRILQPVC